MFFANLLLVGHVLLCNDARYAITHEPTGRLAEAVERVQLLARVPVRVTACAATAPLSGHRAGQIWEELNGSRAILIFIGPALLDALSDTELDGIVAHELAHEDLGLECDTEPNLDCELAVDFHATRWVGYDATLSAMRTAARTASPRARRSFRRRIAGLERLRKDIPRSEEGIPDARLTALAGDIAARAGLPYEPIVYSMPLWKSRGVVNTTAQRRGNRLTIRVSPILTEEMYDGGIRAMLAHELAHPQHACAPDPVTLEYASRGGEVACEHAADALSARWVGRKAALQGLLQLTAIGWDWRYTTDVSVLVERIRLLHDRTDIP